MTHAKSILFAAAVLASSSAFSANIPEGSYPEQPTATASTLARATVTSEALRWNPGRDPGNNTPSLRYGNVPAASRQAVASDRDRWLHSGLAAIQSRAEPEFSGPAYQARLHQFEQGRASAE